MGDLTKLKRIAAAVMSAAFVMGCTGSLKPAAGPAAAAETEEEENENIRVSYNEETHMYEYEFLDVYIYDIYVSASRIEIEFLPSEGGNTFFYEDLKRIILMEPDYRDYFGEHKSGHEWVMNIKKGERYDIKFASQDKYDDITQTGYWGRSGGRDKEYYIDKIIYVRDPDAHYYGDINDDGVVDSFDVLMYRKYISGTLAKKLSEDQFLNADINYDTVIDEEDLQQVVDFTLGSVKAFNGASSIGSVRLDNTVNVQASEGVATDEKFAGAEMKLGVELLKKCYEEDKDTEKNLLLSPLSISAALSMTANGADGETLQEMEKVLGNNNLSLDDINEYMAYYISQLPDEEKEKVYLADSIWFKDVSSFKVYDEFLEANKKFYNAEIYKSAFEPNSIVKDVNSWVNKKTNGMIPSLITKANIKDNTMMLLINTLYFEAEWWSPYLSTTDGKFTDLDGKKYPIKKMESMERQYFDLGNADAFKKQYKNGNYSFVGILPHEDVDFNDYIRNLDAAALAEGLKECEDPNTVDLYVMIPKFKYNYSKSLKEILPELGMDTAFDPYMADFSKINDMSVDGALPLYIDDVIHKTKIEVTEKGTKAAAATAVVMGAGAAAPIEKKKVYIYLDRPFVYMIVDKNNVPLFIGAATMIES